VLFFLSACAAEIRVPVTGRVGSDLAYGYAISRLQGESIFTVDTTKGLRCSGTYNAFDRAPTINAHFTCNDSRAGTIQISRDPGLLTGTAVAALPDGTAAHFVFGKGIRYEDRFDSGGHRIGANTP
jgi:hypothetical protein